MQDDQDSLAKVTRRGFLVTTAEAAILLPGAASAEDRLADTPGPHQALGTRVGEVTPTSAIVWTRLTEHPQRNNEGIIFPPKPAQPTGKPPQRTGKESQRNSPPVTVPVEQIEGACPGLAGRVRLRYGLREDLSDAAETDWLEVTEVTDFIHQFALSGLRPDSTYHYLSQTAALGDVRVRSEFRGKFSTAPLPATPSNFRFCVMTCQGYQDRDEADGHPIYPSMLALQPKFVTLTGDLVYYDNDAPRAVTPALARLHWERIFSLPRLIAMLRTASSYWLKDDHDTLSNDSWAGMSAGELSFAEGQKIFRQQAPMGESSYRTFRWGRDLQLWFTDSRDFRSPNTLPDGPEKTIWGDAQKAWLKRTLQESDATWKILISPTPLVGPDRPKKNDNHANDGFAHEGREMREWLKLHVPDNFFVICGDRHWQYHSIHPASGTQEFSVGPASDSHAGGTPGENPQYHRFHRVKGGFLSVTLQPEPKQSQLMFQLHDVHGAVVYEATFRRPVA